MARAGVKADTIVAAKVEVQTSEGKVTVNPVDLVTLLENALTIESIACSLSISRKTTGGATNNYFLSASIGGIGKIYNTEYEGVDKATVRKTLGPILMKRVDNTFNFIRSCIKKEHEKDGMPIFNLGEFMTSKEST
jgi:hypothetical protein